MCGIAGCITPPGERPDEAALDRMAAALHHRGPDDHGVAVFGNVGLAHTRLAIVDPGPAGHQPMSDAPDGWWLTYNGEIFNHEQLRSRLPARKYRGGSDTETLLHGLATWGTEAIPRCNGLFAFAALDPIGRRLLLVRDRFGVKPLYVARRDGTLWFASEMRALFVAGVPRRLRLEALDEVLAHRFVNGTATPIEGVYRVNPGCYLSIDLDTLDETERCWYDPTDSIEADREAALAGSSVPELTHAVEDTLRVAVKRRLMSDVPVATMLSGGIDSSLITALAHAEQPGIRAYHASIVDQPDFDESPWAERLADDLGIELRQVRVTADSWRADLIETVAHNEYPLAHESCVPIAQIAKLARDDGVKVLLSGEGADELFGGYPIHHHDDRAEFAARFHPLERSARITRRWVRSNGLDPRRRGDRPAGPLVPEAGRYEQQVTERALAGYAHHRGARRRLEAGLAADLNLYLPHLLNRCDKNTMQNSIEMRQPFLDPDVVSLALNLPLERRVEPDPKGVLRAVARARLPAAIARRPKVGFNYDVTSYLESAASPAFLDDGLMRELHGVPLEDWRSVIRQGSGQWRLRLWTGEIWCRIVLDDQSEASVGSDLWAGAPVSSAVAA